MTDRAPQNNDIRRVMDACLPGLENKPDFEWDVLRQVRGEAKVKKKLSVGFVLVMLMIFIAAVALAVVTIQETGRMIAQTEQEIGDYIDWPVEKKVTVICELMDEGYIKETAQRKQLYDGTLTGEEAAQVADEAITEFTGDEARYVSFLGIMNAAWGPFGQWTHEQQAWYSQVMTDVGAETDGKTYYVMPNGPLSVQEALAIAKQEIARGFGLEEGLIDKYRVAEVSFQIPEFAEQGDTKAYWYVCLDTWQTELEDQEGLPFAAIDVFIDPDTGLLLESIEDIIASRETRQQMQKAPIRQTIQNFVTAVGETNMEAFGYWSLESKARWSQEMVPLVNDFVKEHGSDAEYALSSTVINASSFIYALPDAQAIPEEQALQLAGDALQAAYGLTDLQRQLLIDNGGGQYICTYYDVSDPARPLWKFLLRMPTASDSDISETLAAQCKAAYGKLDRGDYNLFYKAELDAHTGEVVSTWTRKYREMQPELYRQEF